MKKIILVVSVSCLSFLIALGTFSKTSRATAGAMAWERVQAQVSDVNPQFPGSNPVGDADNITPSIAWDKTRFNPNRMIMISQFEGNYLAGVADPTVVSQLLGDKVKPVIQDFGHGIKGVPTFIMVTKDIGFVGCSCPPHFEEFMVNVMIQDPGLEDPSTLSPAAIHFAPLYWATDHLKRQETMVHKFSLPEQFVGVPRHEGGPAHIGFIQSATGVSGIYLQNQEGNIVFKANRTGAVIPPPETIVPQMDNIVYSLKNQTFKFHGNLAMDLFNLNNANLTGQYFRLQEPNHAIGFDPTQPPPALAYFSPTTDSLFVDSSSDVGVVLKQVNFHPLFWTSETMNQAKAWTPNPMQ